MIRHRIHAIWVICGALLLGSNVAFAQPPPVQETAMPAPTTRVVTVESLEVQGLRHLSPEAVQTMINRGGVVVGASLKWPEDPRIAALRQELAATGDFSQVVISLEPRSDLPSAVKVIVRVRERFSTLEVRRLIFAASRHTPVALGASLVQRHFLGGPLRLGFGGAWGSKPQVNDPIHQSAMRLDLEAMPGRSQWGGRVRSVGLSAAATHIRADEPAWQQPVSGAGRAHLALVRYQRLAAQVGMFSTLAQHLAARVELRTEAVWGERARLAQTGETVAVDYPIRQGWHGYAALDASLVWDTRPKHHAQAGGTVLHLELTWVPPLAEAPYEFIKAQLGLARHIVLPWRHVLALSAWLGHLQGKAPRFEAFYAGDLSDFAPNRALGLVFSSRTGFDGLGRAVNRQSIASLAARSDVQYVVPLFRQLATRFFASGECFVGGGGYVLGGDAQTRSFRAAHGQVVFPTGINFNVGVRLYTAIGLVDLSLANVIERLPL